MARSLASASSQYLEASAAVVTGYPFTVASWFYPTSTGVFATVWSTGVNSTGNNYFQLGTTSGNFLRFRARTTSNNDCTSGNTISANAWNHAVALGTSAASRTVILNDGTPVTTTGSRDPTGMDRNAFGRLVTSTPTDYMNGRIGLSAIWNVVLSAAEITSLYKGIHPLKIRPAALLGVWPLGGVFSPEPELVSAAALTVTGATKADDPKIFSYQNV